MNVFLRKSDVLKIACLAQSVNVISPILTTTKDGLLKHRIYYPFMLFSNLPAALPSMCESKRPMYPPRASATCPCSMCPPRMMKPAGQARFSSSTAARPKASLPNCTGRIARRSSITAAHQMAGTDPKAFNSEANPNLLTTVKVATPAMDGQNATFVIPPLSFTVLEVTY